MDSIETEDLRGFRLANKLDAMTSNPSTFKSLGKGRLDASVLDSLRFCESDGSLLNQEVMYIPQISVGGVCYGIFDSTHFRDSNIMFSLRGCPSNTLMGVISKIFLYGQNWYFLVWCHHVVSHPNFVDPYLQYGFAAGFLCEISADTSHVIRLADVISHCAITQIPDAGCIHIMPVD